MDKKKLLVALVIVLIIFGLALYYENTTTDPNKFLNNLYNSKKTAIIMDVSQSPKQQITSAIMQCGVNLISGGFYAQTGKELEVYACDKNGCLQTKITDQVDKIVNSTNNTLISMDQVLAQIKNIPYIYIKYGPEQKFLTYPNYLEIIINEQSDPKNCQLKLKTE
ncbi:MAG: hypothetical protein N3D10_02515 [Candidatus Micrarchaeota archaeon]|nr:hypothetical protein [Candidatus Micrarchaeota archaeon]